MKACLKYNAILILLAGCIISCSKKDEYPVIPQIEFLGMTKIFDPGLNRFDRGVLAISFKDGDGDIGLRDNDILPPYDYNFFVKYYELQNGQEVRVIITDSNEFSARIPVLTPAGSVKAIKGEIEDTLNIYNPLSPLFDTIKFDAYIVDRALNKSNTITTGWFQRN
jgi:hypothetical protein